MSLKIQNLKKSFRQGSTQLDILKGLNAEIQESEVVAIIGQSGSGKSTLLSLLAGLDRPDQGEILVGSQRIDSLSEEALTEFRGRHIGIVFQQFHLMSHLTALENVMLPLEILGESNIESRAREMLDSVGLLQRADHLPSQLSGGECQRVAIARALVVQPKILLADEPSGNLDIVTGEKVMKFLLEVVRKHKITTVLVTHNQSLAEQCDRKLTLQNGIL